MLSPTKSFPLLAALCLVGGGQPLHATLPTDTPVTADGGTLTLNVDPNRPVATTTNVNHVPSFTQISSSTTSINAGGSLAASGVVSTATAFLLPGEYAGSVTQTVSGTTVTGSFTLHASARGKLSATTVLSGLTKTYVGTLARDKDGKHRMTGSGYLRPTDGQGQAMADAEKIPVYVNGGTVTGGTLDAAGNVLVFRATPGILTFGNMVPGNVTGLTLINPNPGAVVPPNTAILSNNGLAGSFTPVSYTGTPVVVVAAPTPTATPSSGN